MIAVRVPLPAWNKKKKNHFTTGTNWLRLRGEKVIEQKRFLAKPFQQTKILKFIKLQIQ